MNLRDLFRKKDFWDSFFENYSKIIYASIRRTFTYYNFSFVSEDIEDCYGSIIVKILSQKESIERNYKQERSKFTTYLSVLCANRTIDYLNANKYKYAHVNENEGLFIADEENISLDIDKFLNADSLSDREKLVLKLFYVKELSSKEIAKVLKISDNTVRVTKKKAIDKLREEFHDAMS